MIDILNFRRKGTTYFSHLQAITHIFTEFGGILLPNLAEFHYRVWRNFTTEFGEIMILFGNLWRFFSTFSVYFFDSNKDSAFFLFVQVFYRTIPNITLFFGLSFQILRHFCSKFLFFSTLSVYFFDSNIETFSFGKLHQKRY